MTQQVEKLCADIQAALSHIQRRAKAVAAAGGKGEAQQLETTLHAEIDALDKKLSGDQALVKTAEANVAQWVEAQRGVAKKKLGTLVADGDAAALQARAKAADGYAQATAFLAATALSRAAKAALEAAAAHYHLKSV